MLIKDIFTGIIGGIVTLIAIIIIIISTCLSIIFEFILEFIELFIIIISLIICLKYTGILWEIDMKFIHKPIIVDAEPYREGLEDGYDCYALTGQYLGYYSKKQYPRSKLIPVIVTSKGNRQVSVGDWIITNELGDRCPIKNDQFLLTYEKVEE